MQDTQHLDHAIQIAAEAHDEQSDKTGRPFFDHCRRVAAHMTDMEEKTVAYLHGVAEKGRGWTLDRLKAEGFSSAVLSAVNALTRREGESRDAFVRRAAANPLARAVKRADLEDNLSQMQEIGGDARKYEEGLAILNRRAGQ